MNANSSRESGNQKAARKPRRRLRERFRQETAAALMAAAEEVFSERGLHDASMGEIARRAGVAVGTLYNHFTDREALLGQLLETRRRELLEAIDGSLHELSGTTFVDQLVGLLGALFRHVDAHRGLLTVAFASERGGDPRRNEMARELHARVDKLVRRGVKEGTLRAPGAELHTAMLLGMVRGVFLRDVYGVPSGPMQECVGWVVELFLHGARRSHG
jgi:AcrR family transcriptional regulator